jgi:putative tryptophan/tyrosine transport system substrate-binding protein
MKRREFITLLGGAAAAWPFAAQAQQPGRMQRVGVLSPIHAEEPESKARISTFVLRLRELGWVDGSNVEIVYRWAGDQPDRLPALATELVSRKLGLTVPPTMLAIADEVIE